MLLGTKTLEHLRAVHKRLDALADAIKANGDDITLIMAHTHELALTATPPIANKSTSLSSVVGSNPTTARYPFDFGDSESIAHASDGGSDNLVAGCFRISDIPYSDQE